MDWIQKCPFYSSTFLDGASESTKQLSTLWLEYCHDTTFLDRASATENMWQTSSSAAYSGTMSLHGNISVYHTCVLDGTHICGIRQGNKFYGHECSTFTNISIPLSITAFVFRLGMYGLRSIDFVLDTNTNLSSKGDIPVKDNEFISIIHYQHEVDLEWDVWHP